MLNRGKARPVEQDAKVVYLVSLFLEVFVAAEGKDLEDLLEGEDVFLGETVEEGRFISKHVKDTLDLGRVNVVN